MTDTATVAPMKAAAPRPFPVSETARRRYSCRTYLPQPLPAEERAAIGALLSSVTHGPFGAPVRFRLLAASPEDGQALRGLGTYGFISGAPAFIAGAVAPAEKDLEDYGYALEQVVLGATAMGFGTCWLGGSFSRSHFAKAVELEAGEMLPAVAALGHPAKHAERGLFRLAIGATHRRPFGELFFDRGFAAPLAPEKAGPYAAALETLRLGPSASNRQPWRVVRQGDDWHFFVRRTPGYRKGSFLFGLVQMADLQRVDLGIAMCHFELQARADGLTGRWVHQPPRLELPAETEYSATWRTEGGSGTAPSPNC
jgi:hypothetical protein